MKKMKLSYFYALLMGLALFASSCSERVLLDESPETAARTSLDKEGENDAAVLGLVDCQLVGSPQTMDRWQPDLQNLFTYCHEERVGNCVFFGNNTQSTSSTWPFSYNTLYPAANAMVWANFLYSNMLNNRPSPAANWLLYKIIVHPANNLGGGNFTITIEVIYRYYSCPVESNPGLF